MGRQIKTKRGATVTVNERPGDPPDYLLEVVGPEDAMGRQVRLQLLLDPQNMRDLISELGDCYTQSGEADLSLSEHDKFVRMLKQAVSEVLDDRERASHGIAFVPALGRSRWPFGR
jgi:hypothetical protein